MSTLLMILLVLFAALALIIPLLERHAKPMSNEQQQKLSRWFLPLVGIGLVIALIQQLMQ